MAEQASYAWLALAGLGAVHGINPAMGWLFAVALDMQERRRVAVYRALLPLAFGHALAVLSAAGAAPVPLRLFSQRAHTRRDTCW